jgi:regulatory protein
MFYFEVGNMKITRVEKQKYNEERYNIYVDGSFCFSSTGEDVIKFTLEVDRDFSTDEIKEIIMNCEESSAYNYALRILGIKDYTIKEIMIKLRDKDYSDQTINSIIEKLKTYNFINDSEYIEKYINYGFNIKKFGKNKIIYELEKKGIKRDEIDWTEQGEDIQFENAYSLAIKKYKTLNDKTNKKERIARYLISKGYEYEIIKKITNKIFKDEVFDY